MKSEQQNGVHVGDLQHVLQQPRSFVYAPLPDITAYELSLLLEIVMTSVMHGDLEKAYERLPPEAQRHLQVCEERKPS